MNTYLFIIRFHVWSESSCETADNICRRIDNETALKYVHGIHKKITKTTAEHINLISIHTFGTLRINTHTAKELQMIIAKLENNHISHLMFTSNKIEVTRSKLY